jgi:plasmid maintenance system antidote protein VapI
MQPRHLFDVRMLELMKILKEMGFVRSGAAFAKVIGIPRSNINSIRNGETSFTALHINIVCKEYTINANWIMGIETNLFRGRKNSPALNKMIKRIRTEKEPTPVSL